MLIKNILLTIFYEYQIHASFCRLIFNFMCYIFAYNGTEGTHRYLFARQKYGWEELEYTAYLSLYRVCYLLNIVDHTPRSKSYFVFA